MVEVSLRCRCGVVAGTLSGVSAQSISRIVCYCADCQAFAHCLKRADLLDSHGGSDIVQVAPASLAILQGDERIAGLRLSARGLFRFYARCCNTPLGNVLNPGVPFIGIMVQAFASDASGADAMFGPALGKIHGKYAVGRAPEGSTTLNVRLIARALFLILGWGLRGKSWPHPFFDRTTRTPAYPVTILSPLEREALRRRNA